MPTLKDVASTAKVSTATASLALSGKGRISQDVIARVLGAAEKLGYKKRPPYRKYLKNSRAIAFLHLVYFPITWMFERGFIIEIEKSLLEKNYHPILINISQHASHKDIFNSILRSGARGVFSIHYGHPELFTALEEIGVPVVIINDSSYQDRFNSVLVDDFQGAYEGTLHLIRNGHRRIDYIQFDKIEFDNVNLPNCYSDRFVGFKKALDENGIAFDESSKIQIESRDFEKTVNKLRSVFSASSPPTAFFVQDDHLASCVYVGLNEIGLRVPEDVSLVAPGDVLDYSLPFIPQISTMRIDSTMMARLACDLMISRIEKPTEELHVLKVKQQLIQRRSVKKIV
jgi:DNA-binding LacI/PurR family transcriptional regulator